MTPAVGMRIDGSIRLAAGEAVLGEDEPLMLPYLRDESCL